MKYDPSTLNKQAHNIMANVHEKSKVVGSFTSTPEPKKLTQKINTTSALIEPKAGNIMLSEQTKHQNTGGVKHKKTVWPLGCATYQKKLKIHKKSTKIFPTKLIL